MQQIEIKSSDNEKIKTLRKLRSKKYRNKLGLFCVENWTIIFDALKDGNQFESIFVTEEFLKNNEDKMGFIFKNSNVDEYFVISEKVNESFSSLETAPGICVVFRKTERPVELNKKIIYLNAISDPGNLGTIFRSALAFGFENIVLDENCVDAFSPKTIQASKGSIFNLNISFDKNFEILSDAKKMMKIISTDVEKGKNLKDFSSKEIFCLVLGNETRGVDEEIKKMCDEFLNIKIDSRMESLNVAASASIIFYELGNS
ncbi:MAG: RNA methyltransferase [Candidatus Moranbacteria bacterium]|nr:RNA methyltransferase [Candidatus Moranbacteria bacterium]